MKKTLVLLLGLVLVLSFALVACGDKATEDTTATTAATTATTTGAETATTAAAGGGAAIDWTEAVDYEGETVTITGTVAAVNNLYEEKQINKVLVRLGGDSKSDHFNVSLVLNADGTWPAYLAEYQALLSSLVGKTVEVTGKVALNSFESAYEIVVNDADDNDTPDDALAGNLVVK